MWKKRGKRKKAKEDWSYRHIILGWNIGRKVTGRSTEKNVKEGKKGKIPQSD